MLIIRTPFNKLSSVIERECLACSTLNQVGDKSRRIMCEKIRIVRDTGGSELLIHETHDMVSRKINNSYNILYKCDNFSADTRLKLRYNYSYLILEINIKNVKMAL